MIELNGIQYECSCKIPMDIVDDKWKFLILWHLSFSPLRISELAEKMQETSQRTISRKLKDLEQALLINRKVYAEVPPKVIYSLSEHGIKLLEVFSAMEKWGLEYAIDMGAKITE